MSKLLCCRICKNENLIDVINLGNHYLSSRFPSSIEEVVPRSELVLSKCVPIDSTDNVCNLVQLKHTVNSEEMYFHDYGYRSGINNTMKTHLNRLVEDIECYYVNEGDTILDIGSNDATLLKCYKTKNIKLVGIDPTGLQFRKYYPHNITLVPDYFTKANFDLTRCKKPKVITSLSMFYDLPDPLEFMKDIKAVLAADGVWIMEQSYLPTMIEAFSFDTICHEHLEYYCLEQIMWMADKVDLKIIDVSLNSCNGGSFRVTLSHRSSAYLPNLSNIEVLINKEKEMDINNLQVFSEFMQVCDNTKKQLMDFLHFQKECGKMICIYGASTKGNTLLQYFGIDNQLITCIAEKNTSKYGKFTPGTLIPIISEEKVRDMNPDFMLVLPWHFKDEFIAREKSYLDDGGQFIFPLPYIDVVSQRKKILITGISGQIGTYLKEYIKCEDPESIIYGVVNKTLNLDEDVFYIKSDLQKKDEIENIMKMLMRSGDNHIYNLAGVTDAQVSVIEPLKTYELNAILPLRICDTILKLNRNIRFFQASSSEIFKGHDHQQREFVVNESTLYLPVNPYGIAKAAASSTVKFYRDCYSLFACTGILFNTESPLRSNKFITKKISNGICKIRGGDEHAIKVGNIHAHRDWIHAYDVASAIYKILNYQKPEDYIVSLSQLHSVKNFIETAFETIGVTLDWTELDAYDIKTQKQYILLSDIDQRQYEKQNEMIVGDNTKLKSIGWTNKYSFKDIIFDMTKEQSD
jgi:NDP-4-keto-2,6-dideoxyhexose 3-C-methyltransferase